MNEASSSPPTDHRTVLGSQLVVAGGDIGWANTYIVKSCHYILTRTSDLFVTVELLVKWGHTV